MKKRQSIFNIILVTFFIVIKSYGQVQDSSKKYHIGIALFDEHIAAPFEVRKDAPTHLGGTLSFEMSRKRKGNYQFTHIFQAGYYYHKDFNQVAFISWKPKFELRFAETFNIHAILGVGYAHSFPTQQSYELDNGSYKKKSNLGKPHFMPSVGLGAGLHLDKFLEIPIEVFGRYETFSLAPYATKGRIPITLNTMLSFGVKYSLK